MKTVLRFLVAFLAITGAVALLSGGFGIPFGIGDYWTQHGLLFLVFITFFPRLTLLLSSVPSGGLLWWLGWLATPRLLVALLATLAYWNANPLLVVCAWLIAWGGESSEKYVVYRTSSSRRAGPGGARFVKAEVVDKR